MVCLDQFNMFCSSSLCFVNPLTRCNTHFFANGERLRISKIAVILNLPCQTRLESHQRARPRVMEWLKSFKKSHFLLIAADPFRSGRTPPVRTNIMKVSAKSSPGEWAA